MATGSRDAQLQSTTPASSHISQEVQYRVCHLISGRFEDTTREIFDWECFAQGKRDELKNLTFFSIKTPFPCFPSPRINAAKQPYTYCKTSTANKNAWRNLGKNVSLFSLIISFTFLALIGSYLFCLISLLYVLLFP